MELPNDAPKCAKESGISVSILIDGQELDLYMLNGELNVVCQVNKAYRIKVFHSLVPLKSPSDSHF